MVALRELSREGTNGPAEIFNDPMFPEVFRFPLSTSQVGTSIDGTYLCYGPVVPDGYGCAYNPCPNQILFAIGSFKSCTDSDSRRFKESIRDGLNEIKGLLDDF